MLPRQAAELLHYRQRAGDDLVSFARYVPIAGVPSPESTDNQYDIVETTLAAHHLLILRALQGMADGDLRYDAAELATAGTLPCPSWLAGETPHRGRADGGGEGENDPPPLENDRQNPTTYSPLSAETRAVEPILDADSLIYAGKSGVETLKSAVYSDSQPQKAKNVVTPEDWAVLSSNRGVTPSEQAAWSDAMAEMFGGEICRRVMLMFPPGSAKSTYASVVFPAWDMGRVPDNEIILTGWGDPICRRHGKRARQMCSSPAYKGVFETGIDPATRAAEDWALLNGSSYKSSGIQSGVAGFRCDGLVWDDLTKNRKEADSLTIRTDVYNAYIDDCRSRKKPRAWEVGIGTRWHEDEIMGRILPEGYNGESGFMKCRDGNVWLVLCIPAQCERDDDPLGREQGEYLWPEWFGEDYWPEKKVIPRSWASLYQQRPAPEEGIYFKKEWIKRYSVLPEGDNYISFDPAVTESEDADDTCLADWRVDEYARIYLRDEWVRKCTMDVWITELIMRGIRMKPLKIVSEKGVIRQASEPFIKRAMRSLKAFFSFEYMNRSANKPAMGRGAQAMMASGQIFLPEGEVGDRWEAELLRFPAGKEDHRVDALINLCLHLEEIWEANTPKPKPEESAIISFEGAEMKVSELMPPRYPRKKSRWSHRRH